MSTITPTPKLTVSDKVLWFIDEDKAWYTLIVTNTLVAPENGIAKVQVRYEHFPEDGKFLVPLNELHALPKAL